MSWIRNTGIRSSKKREGLPGFLGEATVRSLELGIALVGKRETLRRNGEMKRERCHRGNMICRLTFVVEEKLEDRVTMSEGFWQW